MGNDHLNWLLEQAADEIEGGNPESALVKRLRQAISPTEDHIRVLRVIEYRGPRSQIERQIASSLHGEKRIKHMTISAATIGTYPEVLENLPVDGEFMKVVDPWLPGPGKKAAIIPVDDK